MGKKARRVPYRLDPQGVKELPLEDIKAILRGADDLIATGGRSLFTYNRRSDSRKVISCLL